jgi:hypothetical protein
MPGSAFRLACGPINRIIPASMSPNVAKCHTSADHFTRGRHRDAGNFGQTRDPAIHIHLKGHV